MHLLAHGLADLIRTVGDPAHLETVSARRRDTATRGDDPRTLERAALDRPTELNDHRTVRAKVAERGDTGTQRSARVAKGLERRQRVALPHLGIEVRFAVEREVAVTVDETGQRELARPADGLAPFVRRGLRDFPALAALDPAMREGVRQVVVVLADGLGTAQLRALCAAGDTPFIASLLARAEARDGAQLIEATTIFPSTTAAAITTLNTARTPQEHGNIAYFIWLEEFAQVTQMLRWGPGVNRRGSYFDDQRIDPRDYVKVGSVHGRIRPRARPGRAQARGHARDAHCRSWPRRDRS